jgi:heme-degrading monooxygenase HmoA
MFSVIFEVLPAEGRKDDYLEIAKHLKPNLESTDGFIDNERFESKLRPQWVLSHSTWRDEKSLVRWRIESEHHKAQRKGRFEIFEDYHLRIGEVIFNSALVKDAPLLQHRFDETDVGLAKFVTLNEITPRDGTNFGQEIDLPPRRIGFDAKAPGFVNFDVFASIYNLGKMVLLSFWRDAKAADTWRPRKINAIDNLRHRMIRIVRDYGRFDRREAPQYYPDVEGHEAKHAVVGH